MQMRGYDPYHLVNSVVLTKKNPSSCYWKKKECSVDMEARRRGVFQLIVVYRLPLIVVGAVRKEHRIDR